MGRFFAVELGVEIITMVGYDKSDYLAVVMDQALAGQPDYVVAVAYSAEAVEFKRILDKKRLQPGFFH